MTYHRSVSYQRWQHWSRCGKWNCECGVKLMSCWNEGIAVRSLAGAWEPEVEVLEDWVKFVLVGVQTKFSGRMGGGGRPHILINTSNYVCYIETICLRDSSRSTHVGTRNIFIELLAYLRISANESISKVITGSPVSALKGISQRLKTGSIVSWRASV